MECKSKQDGVKVAEGTVVRVENGVQHLLEPFFSAQLSIFDERRKE